jgi:flagellar basal-body rod protein FlgC
MSVFAALHTSGSGLTVYRTWLDAVADNIANIDTVRRTSDPAFQERFVVATAAGAAPGDQSGIGSGSRVAGVLYGDAEGRVRYDPGNPLADEQGMVRAPAIDLGDQMVALMVAQRAYQSNLAVIDRVRDAYQQALSIGR